MSANTKEAVQQVGTTDGFPNPQDTYEGVVVGQEWDGDEESLQCRLDIKVVGKHKQAWRPEKGTLAFPENDQPIKSVYLTLDAGRAQSFEYTLKDLRRLGFQGTNFARLGPDYKGKDRFDLVGKTVGVRCRVVERDEGKVRTYWNLAIPDKREERPKPTGDAVRKFLSQQAEAYAAVEEAERSASEDPGY